MVDKRIFCFACTMLADGLGVVDGKTDKDSLASTGGPEYVLRQSSGMKSVG
jgi:hypothetical protein